MPYYDSLLGMLSVWAPDRTQALARARRALAETEIVGIHTTVGLMRRLIELDDFADASHYTTYIESVPGLLGETA
ncbi:MAG: acetyl-CoA carboxylase biotin carboxylase subunit, partial [Leucobacter sp.]|nr:acetyl-CoA carboxylase biotin carboxylase subunit [Leucobacter sp.]